MTGALAGQVALVTGASRGIGRACVLALAAEGADVVINYFASTDAAEDVRVAAERLGVRAMVVRADVGDEAQARHLVESAESAFGRIDVLVNNAGIARVKLLHRMTREDWDEVIRTNLSSAFYTTQAVIPGMRTRGSGRIINVASMVGQHGDPGQANYAAAKAGMIALTKSAAKELARFGVTVNAVCPGYVDTDMSAVMTEDYRRQLLASIPLGRMATAEEVAASVVFLAGPGGSFYTGAELSPNGGQYI